MKQQTRIWLHSLIAALISGGCGGVVNGFAAIGIKPDVFNLGAGIRATLELSLAAFILNAILGVAFFLKQSPLPQDPPTP